jgi:hypothetical protein
MSQGKGINMAESCKIINILPPVDITGGVYGDVFNMGGFAHATIIVQIGVSAAAFTKIIVNNCIDATGHSGTAVAIAHNIYKCETLNTAASGDVLGARTAVAAAGTTPSAVDGIFYVIEIDAAELTDGYNWVELSLTNGANSVIGSAVAILSGSRYGGDQSKTAIA